ncbi:hypothetical protein CH379_004070 [Leptospira ellisii]|uniref:Uncharacterized protein n=1 Tax=Leptospira ellisii TaxID=2023197 RepID=A0AAE4QL50_9LEPT|nr:hypothetical protein [Leptospira ellisii]MDV6234805.1 hypothetical protein [Leptospira ellisii]
MKIFKNIFYFFVLLIVCEAVALGAVAWSFLESSLASYELLKIASDNRARDTLSTLAKAAENSGADRSFEDMNFVFSRMTKLSAKDADGYTIRELFMTAEDGTVLAHSNPEYLQEELRKRKPTALYQDVLYTRAFRLRKWQIGIPVLLGQKKESVSKNGIFSKLETYFPEINEPEILLSAAVYHPVKLERVASIHMVYDRGNFRKFVTRQTELLEWLTRNYSLIALGAALFLEFIYLLLTLGNSKKESFPDLSSRPLVEKVAVASATNVPMVSKQSSPLDSVPFPGTLGTSAPHTSGEPASVPVLTAASISEIPAAVSEPIGNASANSAPVAASAGSSAFASENPVRSATVEVPVSQTHSAASAVQTVPAGIVVSQAEVLDAIYLG